MHKRTLQFLEKKKVIYCKQFGFRANHSTDYAILSIVDLIQHAIDCQEFSCGIFLDFSKAFDTVNQNILIEKLDYYGIRGVTKDWFTSYLTNRYQYVSLGQTASELLSVSCGVPQGSVLGPLLFLIYINHFSNCSEILDFHLFADDANLFYKHKNLKVLESKVNNELVNIHTWLSANKLSLNIDKSNFIIFHPPQKKLPFHVTLSLNGINLNQEYSIKYLGIVIIDSHLSWKSQVSYIAIKIKRNIGVLSKLLYYVNLDVLVKLYYALIYPFLIYGLISWGNTYSSTTQPLVILQKRAMRMITFSKYHEHSSPIFKHLNIVKLPDLVFLNIAVFMHKFHNRRLPSVFDTFFFQVNKKHNYNTRSASSLSYTLPKVRTNYGIFNLRFKGPKVWNSISDNLKTLSISNFKESLKYDLVKDY